MLMVILGAGASYDSFAPRPASSHTILGRPPLADQLFDPTRDFFAEALARYPEALAVATDLRIRARNQTVEQVLEGLRDEAATDHRRHRQLAAIRYYLQDMISQCEEIWKNEITRGATNYQSLLDRIERVRHKTDETVCLVTFNYDTMLDEAMSAVEKQIESIDDYINSESYKVIKLHGSITWGREVEDDIGVPGNVSGDPIVRELTNRVPHLTITNNYHWVRQRPISRADSGTVLFPAIAIPVQSKEEYECPEPHYQTLKRFLPDVTKILIIGWHGAEKHFLQDLKDGLSKNKPQVMVVCGDAGSGTDTIVNMKAAGIHADYKDAVEYGFSHLVGGGRDELDSFLG